MESEKKQQEQELNALLQSLAQPCVPETGVAHKTKIDGFDTRG